MSIDLRSVEILEGNITLQKLMIEILIEVGLSPTIGEDAKLLVVDVDSGLPEVEKRIQYYKDAERPILICALRHSRDAFSSDLVFVERPFSLGTFVLECLNLLELKWEETTAPASLFPELASELMSELGGGNPADDTLTDSSDIEFEFDEESSMILEVSHLMGEMRDDAYLSSEVQRRRIDTLEIQSFRSLDDKRVKIRRPSINQTMPDSPAAIAGNASTDENGLRENSSESGLKMSPQELKIHIRGVARMLAQSWQRIALTARTEDRSDRIEGVLLAATKQGIRGAAEEIQRIPSASGFAGGLDALSLIDVLRTVRDRRLRGRLEIAIGDRAFLLHLDGIFLDAIELLSGDSDLVMLEILNQSGAIDVAVYQMLRSRYENLGDEFEPLEMYLLTQKLVTVATLHSARAVRARELFKSMCGMRGGQFAFLEVRIGDSQSWPTHPLRIRHDEILLEILRESSFETGDSKATARTHLASDPARIAAFAPHYLTELELAVLNIFKTGETLSYARDTLEKIAGGEAIDEVVDRLKKMELLRRIASRDESPGFISTQLPPPSVNTVVSNIPEGISANERNGQGPTRVGSIFEVSFDDASVEDPTANRKEISGVEDPTANRKEISGVEAFEDSEPIEDDS